MVCAYQSANSSSSTVLMSTVRIRSNCCRNSCPASLSLSFNTSRIEPASSWALPAMRRASFFTEVISALIDCLASVFV